ncbi:hypothetical protein B0A55_08078 [Friedmanniomyces simplex]|uniref:Uncharacterized protein n=1 Tax=Friedmanniomyces simplex TaxID=329884 RepID=A0A4U0WWG8_9PEZI|nr:hypothetical protein B0A55_08078 [Friedmanniomyces simplex]
MTNKSRAKKTQSIVQYFNANYGTQGTNLSGWQRLCAEVGALKAVHINILDFVHAKRTGQAVPFHPSRAALSQYIVATGKFFSKRAAKENGYLAALLVEVWG